MAEKEMTLTEAAGAAQTNESVPVLTPDEEHRVYLKVAAAYKDAERKRKNYKKYGTLAMILSGIVFLVLIIGLDSKIDFLILWIVAVLYCAALMIRAEYKYYKIRAILGLEKDDEDVEDAQTEDGAADPSGCVTQTDPAVTEEASK